MKTYLENAVIDFQSKFDAYKRITGCDNTEIAKKLGCSVVHVSRLSNEPSKASAELIFKFLGLYEKANKERWI